MTNQGEGFEMDVHTLEVFFRTCRRFNVADDDKATKIALLRKLVARKSARYIAHPVEYMRGRRLGIIQ